MATRQTTTWSCCARASTRSCAQTRAPTPRRSLFRCDHSHGATRCNALTRRAARQTDDPDFRGYTPANTVTVDAFLLPDDLLEAAQESGEIPSHRCRACDSRDTEVRFCLHVLFVWIF